MSEDRRTEEGFFEEGGAGPPPLEPPPAPRRRESPLLVRSPIFAVLALAVSGWLFSSLASDLAFFFSSRAPIDLGGPGAYHLDAARENRLAQIRGELVDAIPITESRSGVARTVGRIAGTNLLVDRPGRAGPPLYEGRLLPARARADYAEVAAVMQARGAALGSRFTVLRDGERPRRRWPPVVGAALLALVVAVNLRALAKALLPGSRGPR